MQILPDASDALCSSDGKENGMRECQENWPLKHCTLNKTKPNAYLNVWGRRGFTLEQSCSNMRYLHSVQLPSHCGLGKQYSSPILPPPPKKPPPKLVFLWPVIKTWVWMRASVSPGKITHTHSQWEGTNAVCSSPPQNLNGKKGFILHRLADERPRHIFHLSNSLLTLRVYGCTEPVYIQPMYVASHMYVCSRNKKPSASSWLGLELREFGHYAMKTCQTCTSLAERGGVRAKPPHIQHVHRSQITKVATLLNFHHWRELFLWLYQTCMYTKCVCTWVFCCSQYSHWV